MAAQGTVLHEDDPDQLVQIRRWRGAVSSSLTSVTTNWPTRSSPSILTVGD